MPYFPPFLEKSIWLIQYFFCYVSSFHFITIYYFKWGINVIFYKNFLFIL